MTYRTEEEASDLPCPIARTFPEGKAPTCDGSACLLWRWKTITADDPFFKSAVQRTMATMAQEDGSNKPAVSFHKPAVAEVSANLEGYGVNPTLGYCGLGGKP